MAAIGPARLAGVVAARAGPVNDGEGMVAAAVAGLGVTQVPDNMVTGELQSGALVELFPECRPPAMPVSIVMPSTRLQPPRVRALVALLETLHGD